MPSGFVHFLQRWVVTMLAVLVASAVVRGISYDSAAALLVASLVLGFLNAFIRPILFVLSATILVAAVRSLLTVVLGVILVPVINALLLLFVGGTVKGFHVNGFWAAFWGGLVIGIVSLIASLFLGKGPKVEVRRGRRPKDSSGGPDAGGGDGPVIDV
jgi:putative membrane protein